MIINDKLNGRRDIIYESIYNIGDFICHVIVASHAENVDVMVSRKQKQRTATICIGILPRKILRISRRWGSYTKNCSVKGGLDESRLRTGL
jgi:hypothetical protein